MKRMPLIMSLTAGVLLLSGCSKSVDSFTDNTLIVQKDSRIEEISVEDYSDGNYNMTDLENFINDQVDSYNSSNSGDGEDQIKVQELTTENNVAKLALDYASIEDYNAFNGTEYELKNLADASISGTFTDASSGENVSASDITDDGYQILKVTDATNLEIKGKVMYYNANVADADDVLTTSGEGTAIVIFK